MDNLLKNLQSFCEVFAQAIQIGTKHAYQITMKTHKKQIELATTLLSVFIAIFVMVASALLVHQSMVQSYSALLDTHTTPLQKSS